MSISYEDKTKQRQINDDQVMESAFMSLAGSVTGKSVESEFGDKKVIEQNTILELLKYFRIRNKKGVAYGDNFIEQMENTFRPYGIMYRPVELDGDWYRNPYGSLVGFLKSDGRSVAIIPYGYSTYYYYDSKLEKKVRITKKNVNDLEPRALMLYKTFPMQKIGFQHLLKYILEQLSLTDILLIAFSTLVVTLIGLISPILTKQLFGSVAAAQNLKPLIAIGIFMIAVSISSALTSLTKKQLIQKIKLKQSMSIQAATMIRILSLPPDFFKDYSSMDISMRVGYVNSLSGKIIDMFFTASFQSLFTLTYIFELVKFTPTLVLPAICIIIIQIAAGVLFSFKQREISKKMMDTKSKEQAISYSLVSGIQKIRLAGAEKRAFALWSDSYSRVASLKYNPPFVLKVNTAVKGLISTLGLLVIYIFAYKSKVSVSDFYAFNSAYGMVSGAFTTLASTFLTAADIQPILERIEPIFKAEPEVSETKEIVRELTGEIVLDDVQFRYDEKLPYVLNGISLTIRPGEYVAIVGRTGCGKSTLMRLLLGFEKATYGAVYYDNKDINNLDLKSLRQNMGVVLQDGKLFQGDIYSNITISKPTLTLDEAWEAARLAGVEDDIKAMPMNMHTYVTEGAGGVSGGQKQRILIARAIAPKPKILMFDEATSALDNITQKMVSDSLDSLKCTRIVIAHRLSTIRNCDRIIVLDGGKIVENGTYDELIKNNGFFAELVSRQRLDG